MYIYIYIYIYMHIYIYIPAASPTRCTPPMRVRAARLESRPSFRRLATLGACGMVS